MARFLKLVGIFHGISSNLVDGFFGKERLVPCYEYIGKRQKSGKDFVNDLTITAVLKKQFSFVLVYIKSQRSYLT